MIHAVKFCIRKSLAKSATSLPFERTYSSWDVVRAQSSLTLVGLDKFVHYVGTGDNIGEAKVILISICLVS